METPIYFLRNGSGTNCFGSGIQEFWTSDLVKKNHRHLCGRVVLLHVLVFLPRTVINFFRYIDWFTQPGLQSMLTLSSRITGGSRVCKMILCAIVLIFIYFFLSLNRDLPADISLTGGKKFVKILKFLSAFRIYVCFAAGIRIQHGKGFFRTIPI